MLELLVPAMIELLKATPIPEEKKRAYFANIHYTIRMALSRLHDLHERSRG